VNALLVLDATRLTLFLVTAFVILVTPGPAVLYIVARSVDQGRLAGIVSTLGVGVGTMFHVAAAALGVSALLATSATAFSVLKYLGAAYLVYLGIRKLMESDLDARRRVRAPESPIRIFWQGVVVNVLNPKTALFFLAFLPQFIDVSLGHATLQMIVLGLLFVIMGILSDGTWALVAGSAGGWLKSHLGLLRAQRYFSGSVFIALGIAMAVTGQNRK
jgi:threonine/homoserine/homoserine lactone efflux protein